MMAAADRITIENHRQGRPRRAPLPDGRPGAGGGAHHHGGAEHRLAQRARHRQRRHQPVRHAGGRPGRLQRGAGQGHAGGHGAHLQPRGAGLVERRLHEVCTGVAMGWAPPPICTTSASTRPPSTPATRRVLPPTWPKSWWATSMWTATWTQHGGEDFSFMLQVKPGAYLRLGQGDTAWAAASCTTAATTSTTRCCRWARPCMPACRAGHAAGDDPASAAARPPSTFLDPATTPPRSNDEVQADTVAALVAAHCAMGAARRRPCASATRAMPCRWTRTRSTSRCS
jgi:hypothetical protein